MNNGKTEKDKGRQNVDEMRTVRHRVKCMYVLKVLKKLFARNKGFLRNLL
jgi:hypothetical protein